MKERQTVDLTGHSEMEMETRMFRWRLKVRPVLELPAADPARIRERQPVERAVPAQRHRPVLELQSRRRTRRAGDPRAADRTETAADSRRRPSERREKVDSPAVSKGSDGRIPYRKSENPEFFFGAILRAMR